ncbi:MAG: efflux RND transporter periplasmic adaptor subunit [Spirosomataceae bacterium]
MKNTYPLLLLLLLSCGKEPKSTTSGPTLSDRPAVTLITPQVRSLSYEMKATGLVAHKQDIRLAFKTPGLVKKIYVQEGQWVKQGQLLAELDLSEIQSQTEQARLAVEKATRDYERAKRLVNDQAALPQAMEDALTGLEAAKQQQKTAQFNLKLSKIYAPTSGRILRKLAESGELIGAFQPVLLMGSGATAQVVLVGVSARDLVQISMGQSVQLRLEAYPEQTFFGKVTQKAVAPSPGTGQYEVEITLQSTKIPLQSGFIAQALFSTSTSPSSLAIPIEAFIEGDGQNGFVFLYDASQQRVRKTPVKVGKTMDRWIQVLEGIQPGDSLVSAGANFLTDQELVKSVRL